MAGVFSGKANSGSGIDWVAVCLLAPPPLFWAGNFLVGRMLRDTIPPFTMLFWRWVIALVLLLPFVLRIMARERHLYLRHVWRLLGVSLTGIVAFNSFVYFGLQRTAASNAMLLNSLIPILIMLIAACGFGMRLRGVQAVGVLVSFCGVLFIITKGAPAQILTLSFSGGDLIVFCGMVSFAFYTLWLKGFPAEMNRTALLACQIAVGLVILTPIYFWEQAAGPTPQWSAWSCGWLAFLGVFPSVLAYLFFNLGVARVGAAKAGLAIHLIPVFGVVLAVLFLGERVHLYQAVGIGLIAAGIFVATRRARA